MSNPTHASPIAVTLTLDLAHVCLMYDRWLADRQLLIDVYNLCPDCVEQMRHELDLQVSAAMAVMHKKDKHDYLLLFKLMPNLRKELAAKLESKDTSEKDHKMISDLLYEYEALQD